MVNTNVVDAHLSTYHKGCTATNIPKSAIVIKATTKWGGKRRVPLSCDQRKVLFEQCPEYTIKDKNSRRCDPLLCLFDGCHLMGIENEDVENGIANGTTCIFKKAYLKHGATLQPIELNGYLVNSVSVEDVEFSIVLNHATTGHKLQG
jgi:hypothetical protein